MMKNTENCMKNNDQIQFKIIFSSFWISLDHLMEFSESQVLRLWGVGKDSVGVAIKKDCLCVCSPGKHQWSSSDRLNREARSAANVLDKLHKSDSFDSILVIKIISFFI